MNVHKQRMQNVVQALQETKYPELFHMHAWGKPTIRKFLWLKREVNDCGTPACVLGNYAIRTDLQKTFRLVKGDLLVDGILIRLDSWRGMFIICNHFGITREEATEVFGPFGCADASTPEEAIDYIRGFIDRKWPRVETPELVTLKKTLYYEQTPVS